ncbi:MAG: hypothetical protein ACR2H0_03470 [Candidatus Limnocylindrales bacterium]
MDSRGFLSLQRAAGNRAVAALLGGLAGIQRRPKSGLAALMGESDIYAEPLSDKPVESMGYNDVKNEISDIRRWLDKQTTSTHEENRRSIRLRKLDARLQELQTPTAPKKGKDGPRGKVTVPKPLSLSETLDISNMGKADMAAELDTIVAYLRTSPGKSVQRKLAPVRAALEDALGMERVAKNEEIRKRDIAIALRPLGGNAKDQFEQVVKTIHAIKPSPDNPEVALLEPPGGGMVIPVSHEEAKALKDEAGKLIRKYARQSADLAVSAYDGYRERVVHNNKQWIVHGLVKWSTGVDDLDELEMFGDKETARGLSALVTQLVKEGNHPMGLWKAFALENFATSYAQKVGSWEAELVGGAGRWVLGLTILKEGLTLLATAGAGALITAKAAQGVSTVRAALTVGGATTAAGGGGAFVGSLAEQAAGGEGISVKKTLKATAHGAGTGLSVGGASGAGAVAKQAFGVGKAASTSGNVVRAVGAEVVSSTTVNVAAAGLQGESLKDAAVSSIASAPISAAGGVAVKNIAQGNKVVETAGGAIVGSGSNVVGALAAGKKPAEVKQAALVGAAGGAIVPHVEASAIKYHEGQAAGAGGAGGTSTDQPGGGSSGQVAGGGSSAVRPPDAPDLMSKFDLSDVGGVPAVEPPRQAPVMPVRPPPKRVVPATAVREDVGTAATLPEDVGAVRTQPEDVGGAPTQPENVGVVGTLPAAGAGRNVGSAGTLPAPDTALAATPAAPQPIVPVDAGTAAGGTGAIGPQTPPARPNARPLLPASAVPADMPAAAKPAIELHPQNQYFDKGHDIAAQPNPPTSTPTADFPADQPGRYVPTGEKPLAGLSAESSFVVKDTADSDKLHLFKPLAGETAVDRAEARGIRAGEQGPREVAAHEAAIAVGVSAPRARLVTINGQKGVLVEWQQKNTLADLALTDRAAFDRLIKSEKFKDAMGSLDALDYLINNLDRALNFGNYLYEFLPNGTLKLTAIDHGLTFTSTKERASVVGWTRELPESYSADLKKNLTELGANRDAFIAQIRPFIGEEAVPGVLQRLDTMLSDMRAKERKP